ncbi:MAG: type II toxin-antitoxin system RelE/ParE family toxin [Nitrosomonas sp.]|nr:type II toxin-antitoxin system RelE/ParE family toxin [Nitrosomonas sp.]
MSGYELTTLAEEDMKAIARYTIDTWGEGRQAEESFQSGHYLMTLTGQR